MALWQRQIRKALTDSRKRIIESFASQGAYSKESGIPFEAIGLAADRLTKETFQGMVHKGVIRESGGLYWFNPVVEDEVQNQAEKLTMVIVVACIVVVGLYFIFFR
jgi:hypothetical protein